MNDLRMGIPGVGEIHPGSHVCAFYSGPGERDQLLVSFMREGLRRGDQCVFLIDDLDPPSMLQRGYGLGAPGPGRGRLDVYPAPDVYLRSAEHSVQRMISALVAAPASAADEPPLLRAAGEMSLASRQPGGDVAAYETAVGQILAALPALLLCVYDVRRLGVGMLVDVLRQHSAVLLGGAVLHNLHASTPTEDSSPPHGTAQAYSLARRHAGSDVGDQWLSLTGAEVRVAELVASGMKNRAVADELVISSHTVDAHLKHIYLKLGIHSRVELTVRVFRHGSPTD